MKIYIRLLLLLSLCSCSKNVDFTIENNTTNPIDSIIITNGYDRSAVLSLEEKETGRCTLLFSENVKADGSYCIEVYQNNAEKKQNFGYYSNGSPLDKEFKISIQNDTIHIKN